MRQEGSALLMRVAFGLTATAAMFWVVKASVAAWDIIEAMRVCETKECLTSLPLFEPTWRMGLAMIVFTVSIMSIRKINEVLHKGAEQ